MPGDSPFSTVPRPSLTERQALGRKLRDQLPRASLATWEPGTARPDVLEILWAGARDCLPEFVPLRFGRIAASPFAFFRGTAPLMAADLAGQAVTGLKVQASGDAHLANFGAFATAERQLVFDLNDFDETLRAPWEWDIKRLCASAVLAAREAGHSETEARTTAQAAARSYRQHLLQYARQTQLDIFYDHIDAQEAVAHLDSDARRQGEKLFAKARSRNQMSTLQKLALKTRQGWRLCDDPPLVQHIPQAQDWVAELAGDYLETVRPDCRALLSRYELTDTALKITGVGSCGRRVLVLLLSAGADDVLFLQAKEARPSVLEPYAGSGALVPAQRVVLGQQLMQSARDPFLGWSRGPHSFYVRQLRDMKASFDLSALRASTLAEVAELCGWVLARAHARTGDAVTLAAYLGTGQEFDLSLARFAVAYADQTEQDFAILQKAVASGKILVENGEK